MEITKRQTKTIKWYAKDFVRALKEEPTDWVLAAYVTVGCLAACAGVGIGYIFMFLVENLIK